MNYVSNPYKLSDEPLEVEIELTNETFWKPLSDKQKPTSHLPLASLFDGRS